MANKVGITRAQYKNLKRMDRKQTEDFIKNIYAEGFRDGKKSAQHKIKPSDIAEVLVRVKGIGVKNVAEVMVAINELYRTGEVEEG